MKLANGTILEAKEPLKQLIEQKFPVLVSYKLVKLVNKLNEHYKVIEETRQGLVRTYGVKDERTGNIAVKQEDVNYPKFVSELNELLSQEVEIVFEKVKLPDTLEIEPSALLALEKFVEV